MKILSKIDQKNVEKLFFGQILKHIFGQFSEVFHLNFSEIPKLQLII
jgi:hypothetical protein